MTKKLFTVIRPSRFKWLGGSVKVLFLILQNSSGLVWKNKTSHMPYQFLECWMLAEHVCLCISPALGNRSIIFGESDIYVRVAMQIRPQRKFPPTVRKTQLGYGSPLPEKSKDLRLKPFLQRLKTNIGLLSTCGKLLLYETWAYLHFSLADVLIGFLFDYDVAP